MKGSGASAWRATSCANSASPRFLDVRAGIPIAAFEVGDIAGEFARLTAKSVAFTQQPTPAGPVTIAVFADTCGNLIQLYQPT